MRAENHTPKVSPLRRFEDLARRLLAVPKNEVEERRAEYERSLENEKARKAD